MVGKVCKIQAPVPLGKVAAISEFGGSANSWGSQVNLVKGVYREQAPTDSKRQSVTFTIL